MNASSRYFGKVLRRTQILMELKATDFVEIELSATGVSCNQKHIYKLRVYSMTERL